MAVKIYWFILTAIPTVYLITIIILLVFLEEAGPGPVVQPLGTQVQLISSLPHSIIMNFLNFFGQTSIVSLDETDVVKKP